MSFCRYKNEIFFTWNKSNAIKLFTFLQEEIREKHRNVRFEISIDSKVSYMNAYIENRQGHVYTRVHHQPTIQLYALPYVKGHSQLAHSDHH